MELIIIPGQESMPLQTLLPKCTKENAKKYSGPINQAFARYYINTPIRIAMWLAQAAHESASFKYSVELWGPTPVQLKYERNFSYAWPPTPQDDFNKKAFELGNYAKGDGYLYRGRAAFQNTGRTNYEIISKELNYDFVSKPDDLALPGAGTLASGFFWYRRGLNALADKGDYRNITKRINGGFTHYDRRKKQLEDIMKLMNISSQILY